MGVRRRLGIAALVVDAHVVADGGTNARTAQCYRCTGTNIVLRGLSMTRDDEQFLILTGALFDGLYG